MAGTQPLRFEAMRAVVRDPILPCKPREYVISS